MRHRAKLGGQKLHNKGEGFTLFNPLPLPHHLDTGITKARGSEIDGVVFLCPTRHKIGHFGDVSRANVLAW